MQIGDKVRVHRHTKLKDGTVQKRSYFGFIANVNSDGTYNVWYIDSNGGSFSRNNLVRGGGTDNDQVEPWVN